MFDEKSHSLKMDKSIEALLKELSSLRTGRANAAMCIDNCLLKVLTISELSFVSSETITASLEMLSFTTV